MHGRGGLVAALLAADPRPCVAAALADQTERALARGLELHLLFIFGGAYDAASLAGLPGKICQFALNSHGGVWSWPLL